MLKKQYRVRNWSEYNKALIGRGRITLWFDEASINQWYEEKNQPKKRGRPNKYSDVAIVTMLMIKQVYHLTLRSCHGFVESIMHLMSLGLDVPDYTRVCRRQGHVHFPKLPVLGETIHLVVDSSGLKVYGEGEWKVRQHGWTKRRTWRKLHIGVDANSQLIVTALLTGNDCGDDQKLPTLLDQYEGSLKQVSADGAYDSHACHEQIHGRGAKSAIPPQANPKHKRKTADKLKRPRDYVVWEVQEKGRAAWKKESGYHRRNLVETAFGRYKGILGDKLKARQLNNQSAEALARCHALNRMTLLGMPLSVAI